MRAISICGLSKSGKTTATCKIVEKLVAMGYTVGTVKDIHFEAFTLDGDETKNTYKHRASGSSLVTARGLYETDIMFQEKKDIYEILENYNQDFVIMEGVRDCNVPMIVTGKNAEEVEVKMDKRCVAITGVIANSGIDKLFGIDVINTLTETEKLVQVVLEKAMTPLPNFDEKCCGSCGFSCKELTERVINGESSYDDCVLKNSKITLEVGGKNIEMVPFVQSILKNSVVGVCSLLKGVDTEKDIVIKIKK